jgi:hypothetical protein
MCFWTSTKCRIQLIEKFNVFLSERCNEPPNKTGHAAFQKWIEPFTYKINYCYVVLPHSSSTFITTNYHVFIIHKYKKSVCTL